MARGSAVNSETEGQEQACVGLFEASGTGPTRTAAQVAMAAALLKVLRDELDAAVEGVHERVQATLLG